MHFFFLQVATQIRNFPVTCWAIIRSLCHIKMENRWIVLRLALFAVIGIPSLVGSGLAVWTAEGTGSVRIVHGRI